MSIYLQIARLCSLGPCPFPLVRFFGWCFYDCKVHICGVYLGRDCGLWRNEIVNKFVFFFFCFCFPCVWAYIVSLISWAQNIVASANKCTSQTKLLHFYFRVYVLNKLRRHKTWTHVVCAIDAYHVVRFIFDELFKVCYLIVSLSRRILGGFPFTDITSCTYVRY